MEINFNISFIFLEFPIGECILSYCICDFFLQLFNPNVIKPKHDYLPIWKCPEQIPPKENDELLSFDGLWFLLCSQLVSKTFWAHDQKEML